MIKTFFETLVTAFSMFSRIPMPHIEWNDRNMRYMLAAFPLVGVVTGALICGWTWLCGALDIGSALFSAGFILLPILVTGGIHLDGFCDTSDALASHASPERKREIMRDSHAGAFAVISAACYLLLYFALGEELARGGIPAVGAIIPLALAQVMSRAASGFCSITYPSSGSGGLLAYFRGAADKRLAAGLDLCIFAAAAAVAIIIAPLSGVLMAAGAAACAAVLYFVAKKEFGGMSGDLAGWFLQVAELLMLAALVITVKVV